MPLSWNEIKTRAVAFAQRWHDAASENSEAKLLIDFFEIFGITNKLRVTQLKIKSLIFINKRLHIAQTKFKLKSNI